MAFIELQPCCSLLSFANPSCSIARLFATPSCSICHARIRSLVGGSAYKLVIGCFHRLSFGSGNTKKSRLLNSKQLGLPFPCESHYDA